MSDKNTDKNFMQNSDGQLIKEQIQGPYQSHISFREPALCTECESVYLAGRWQWLSTRLQAANEGMCPACQRIHDNIAAGSLSLRGDFFKLNCDEILSLVFHIVAQQKSEYPMRRIMDIEDINDGLVISFTDTHLLRSVGETIQDTYKGELYVQVPETADGVRATWIRQQ